MDARFPLTIAVSVAAATLIYRHTVLLEEGYVVKDRREIYVSTGGYPKSTALQTARAMRDVGLVHIELSGGLHTQSLEQALQEFEGQAAIQLHNYYPPPRDPFVLNLASRDYDIRTRSIEHVRNAIRLTSIVGASRFSFHAGFLGDPPVAYLGAPWEELPLMHPSEGFENFVNVVTELCSFADGFGIELLIENNVLTSETLRACGPDVLLMTSPDQILEVLAACPNQVGLLMDVAHLKVSAQTLGINPVESLNAVAEKIRGYHLSDNSGTRDSNHPVTEDSWFWDHLSCDVPFATLELTGLSIHDLLDQVELVRRRWR